MTDRARLEKALIAADKAGDTEAARKLATALRGMPAEDAAPPPVQQPAPQPQAAAPQQERSRPVGGLYESIIEPFNVLGSSAVAAPVAGLAGIGAMGTKALGMTQADPGDVVARVQEALTYRPRSFAGEFAAKYSPLAMLTQGLAKGADYVGETASDVTGSPAVGAAVNTAIQAAPMLLFRGRGKAASVAEDVNRTPPVARTPAARPPEPTPAATAKPSPGLAPVSKSVPTLEELDAAAKAAYKRASDAGIVVSEGSFKGLKTRLVTALKKEGIDKTLHPSTTAAIKRITETKGPVTLEGLETLRRIASDAKGSLSAADRRLAARVVDDLDDYVDNLGSKDVTAGNPAQAAALKEARDLYSRKKKAEEIDKLIRDAQDSAANFSGSGLENALRTEFRKLSKNEKRMRRFSKEEQAAIRKVARGGPLENTARFIGKFAPTGVVSGVLTGGAGAIIGGPLGAALPLAGIAGRATATRMTVRNAKAAGELMRRGPARQEVPAQKRNKLAELNY